MASSVCVQNHNNLAHRTDDALLDNLAKAEIAYVPFHLAALPHSNPRPFKA
jgi:pyridoxine 4-dehydrogenase